MTTDRVTTQLARGELTEHAARVLGHLATETSQSLARIAKAYEEYVSGRCDEARVIEVVRQETAKAAFQPRQATRRSGPVRG
jgi:hypothetical protein